MNTLTNLQYPTGLIAAASKTVSTGYDKAWIRDNLYTLFGLESAGEHEKCTAVVYALLNALKKHEYKIDWMICEPHPKHKHRYIHARFHPETLDEFQEDWGNKQNDAVGMLLWQVGRLHKNGTLHLREEDLALLQKLVSYLDAIEYWNDEDNGMWEENEEVHASSVGACLAGLLAIDGLVDVPLHLIANGEHTLRKLLPRESKTKHVDLALLSLIWPYNIVTEDERALILKNVEEELVREKGVIRYHDDCYYSNGSEAEWTMGFPWLAIIYKQLGKTHKHQFYLKKTKDALNEKGELPELYYGGTSMHNENTPLAWAVSLMMVAEH